MSDNPVFLQVIAGIAIAVGAAVVLGLPRWLWKQYRRREQIAFVRDTIVEMFRRIGCEEPHIDVNGLRAPNAIEQRAKLFNYFLRHMETTLENSLMELDSSEKSDIRFRMNNIKDKFETTAPKDDWQDKVMYSCCYSELHRAQWLKLPKKLPWRATVEDPLVTALESLTRRFQKDE